MGLVFVIAGATFRLSSSYRVKRTLLLRLRAILESIVFRVYQIFETMQKEKLTRSSRIRYPFLILFDVLPTTSESAEAWVRTTLSVNLLRTCSTGRLNALPMELWRRRGVWPCSPLRFKVGLQSLYLY